MYTRALDAAKLQKVCHFSLPCIHVFMFCMDGHIDVVSRYGLLRMMYYVAQISTYIFSQLASIKPQHIVQLSRLLALQTHGQIVGISKSGAQVTDRLQFGSLQWETDVFRLEE